MKPFPPLLPAAFLLLTACHTPIPPRTTFSFPPETARHEGTWLAWPHPFTYGAAYPKKIEPIWIQIVQALHPGEKIHIIAYNPQEQRRITALLTRAGVNMHQVDFTLAESNDVWIRDTGPIFLQDQTGALYVAGFRFNGWGQKVPYEKDAALPKIVAAAMKIPFLPLDDFVLEGGAVELDGHGTAMLCKSSLLTPNRNPNMCRKTAEALLQKYLGASHFIWLEGVPGEDITDAHIDGLARFLDDSTILTVRKEDFFDLYNGILPQDYNTLRSARNAAGRPYKILELPLTQKNVRGLDYKGSYLNFYVGNDVLLLPLYQDKNDPLAVKIMQKCFPNRKIIGIDVTALYPYGGMLHCVTQQQPAAPHAPPRQ